MKKQEMKSLIIQLSKEYSLVTPFTSFVAVEKRTAEENIDLEPNVAEIISAEDVDILPYMDWSSLNDMQTMPFSCAAIEERISEERSGSSSFVDDERSMESETQDTEYDDVISDMPPPPPPLGLIPDHRPVPLPGAGQPLLFGSAPFGSLPSGGSSLPSLQIAVMPSNSLFGQSSSDMCPLPPRLGLIPDHRPVRQPGAGRPLLFGSASFGSLP
ncbi:hypothetical protein GDO78_000498, partial [Eleutherodactylus coqui]